MALISAGPSCVAAVRLQNPMSAAARTVNSSRREILTGSLVLTMLAVPTPSFSAPAADRPQFYDLQGLKVLDIQQGSGRSPLPGDEVEIHYYARLAAKQGWRFDSTYDHKDSTGAPEPYVFAIRSGTVIEGLDLAVQTMKEGGVRRVIIPPSKGYQNTSQGPIPPNASCLSCPEPSGSAVQPENLGCHRKYHHHGCFASSSLEIIRRGGRYLTGNDYTQQYSIQPDWRTVKDLPLALLFLTLSCWRFE